MTVYWHGYGLENPHSGICRYAKNLHDAISKDFSPMIFGHQDQLQSWPQNSHQPVTYLASLLSRYGVCGVPGYNDKDEGLVIHGHSNVNVPIFQRRLQNVKYVLTIHDLIPLLSPDDVSMISHMRMRLLLPRAVGAADQIIAVSEWTKSTILEYFPWIKGKIKVIGHGKGGDSVDTDPVMPGTKYNILMVARGETYKRIPLFHKIAKALGSTYQFSLITDEKGEKMSTFIGSANVQTYRGLGQSELNEMYKSCDAYVQTSRFEGYCLPAVEAMRYGKPVVYELGTALDTTVGNVGIALEQRSSVETWGRAVKQAVQMHRTGESRQRIFDHYDKLPTWDQVASEIACIYNALLAEGATK